MPNPLSHRPSAINVSPVYIDVMVVTDQEAGLAPSLPGDRPGKHRRRLAATALVLAAGLSGAGWWLAGGNQQGPPPGTGKALGGPSPAVPTGSKLVSSRSIDHSTLRIYASPSGLPIAKVDASYELIDPQGQVTSSGSGSIGAALLAPSGVVHEGGGTSDGPAGWQGICDCQVTNPAITLVRLVSGPKVLDAMVPFTFDSVRFVVLAAINVPTLRPIIIQGLDAQGTILTSAPL
jgi:hypothetical protein